MLDGIDVPDVHGVIDCLDSLAQRVPGLPVMATRAETVRLQLPEADAHLLKMRLAVEAALVADGVDLSDNIAQFGMMFEQLDDLPDLIVEAGPLRRIARRIVETRFLAEARREDEMERGHLALKLAKAFVQPHHHILGREVADARDLFRGVGRLAEERELQPDRADIRLTIETAGHVVRGLAMGVARGKDQLCQVEDLEVAIESIVVAEADQTIDIGGAFDRERSGSVDLGDLRFVHLALRAVEKFRQTRPDELRIERSGEVDVLVAKRNGKAAKEGRKRAGHGMTEQRFDWRVINAKPAEERAKLANLVRENLVRRGLQRVLGQGECVIERQAAGLADELREEFRQAGNDMHAHACYRARRAAMTIWNASSDGHRLQSDSSAGSTIRWYSRNADEPLSAR